MTTEIILLIIAIIIWPAFVVFVSSCVIKYFKMCAIMGAKVNGIGVSLPYYPVGMSSNHYVKFKEKEAAGKADSTGMAFYHYRKWKAFYDKSSYDYRMCKGQF